MWYLDSVKAKNIISFGELDFEIRNGQALPIVGQNLDDLGQEANGAGKSGLFEIVSMGITGDGMRKVRTKENIREGEDEGEVELVFKNDVVNKIMLITRTFRQKKSTIVNVEVNGKVPKIKTSDSGELDSREANIFILDQLGISREDLYNYYLISSQNFSPFLNASDTKKKEIISRFSNTQSVDAIIQYVEKDSDAFNDEVAELEKELVGIQSAQNVYKEQLKEMDEGEFAKLKREKIEKLEANIDASNESIKQRENKITEIKAEIKAIENEVLDDKKDLKEEEAVLQKIEAAGKKAKDAVSAAEVDYNNKKETLSKERTAEIVARREEAMQDAKTEESILNGLKNDLEKIRNQMRGAITCPNCEHEFKVGEDVSMKDLQKREGELKTEIAEEESTLNKIHAFIDKKQVEYLEAQKGVIAELNKDAENIKKLQEKLTEIRNDYRIQESTVFEAKSGIRDLERRITNLQSSINSQQEQIDSETSSIESYKRLIKEEEAKTLDTKKQEIEDKIEELDDKYLDKTNEMAAIVEKKEAHDNWILAFKKFKTRLANNSIKTIETFANFYLGKMKSNLRIQIDGYKTLASGQVREQISTTVFRDGVEKGSYGKFSAGERARIDISVTAALQSIINSTSDSGGLNMLFMDEVLDAVDTLGLKSIIHALQDLGITIMLVTQNTIDQLGEGCLLIQKENGLSKILLR